MAYFKVIINNKVVDVGSTFLYWNAKHQCLMVCDRNDAQLAQSYKTDDLVLYHDSWLLNVPAEMHEKYTEAQIVMIGAVEYDELLALIDDGEDVPVPPEPEPQPEPQPIDPDDPDERPMTVAEMREKVTEQEEQIQMLIECILEMSEVVYG